LEERRRFPRINKNSTVEFKELEFPISKEGFFTSHILNISANGVIFEAEKKFSIDTMLQLRINLIGWHKEKNDFYKFDETAVSEPLLAIGRVVRIEELKKAKSYKIGVEFINLNEDDKEALISFIQKSI